MVTNSFGNRNFMLPMEGSASTQSSLNFFLLEFWVEGGGVEARGGDFFRFSFVHFKFSMSFHQVPNVFPMGVPNCTSL
jgi:hypothetical protein